MFLGNVFWHWKLSNCDELEEERLKKKVFVTPWGWSQKGKGDHSRFPATELGMRLGVLDLTSTRRGLGQSLAYLMLW